MLPTASEMSSFYLYIVMLRLTEIKENTTALYLNFKQSERIKYFAHNKLKNQTTATTTNLSK